MDMKTVVLNDVEWGCVCTALLEKIFSLPKESTARKNYEKTYETIKGK